MTDTKTTAVRVEDFDKMMVDFSDPTPPTPAALKARELHRHLIDKQAWLSMEKAPKDGTWIVALYDYNCGMYHPVAVHWSEYASPDYPWKSKDNEYPEDRLAGWAPIPRPWGHHDD